jgi:signal transduction histidine kinase
LGPGDPPAPVPERGPRAVRAAIQSFNAMSTRLLATLESQRVVMAAVAHDLRSPITSLRLRAEFVTDADTKERMLETLADMQTMTEAVIDLARAGKSTEEARLLDLNALAESLTQDIADSGAPVSFQTGAAARAMIRRSEVTRALRNLVENAIRYGGRARVSLEIREGFAAIHIDDDGPGVPADQLEALFMPFARLESSRSQETGGHGLGLTIARMIARGHGGDVTLQNRTPRGLRATLRLRLADV